MNKKRKLQELTIKDNFMFGAVMMNPEHCKDLLELVLDIKIERVDVDKEKSIVYNPEFKGVRLDIYAKDEKNTHYNVEMQALPKCAIHKRARYYHDQIDMDLLLSGMEYRELPDSYVIFICDFDPYGEKKYRYTQMKCCEEMPELDMSDGTHTIYLSTKGENKDEVPGSLVKLLEYIQAPLSDSEKDFEDDFVRRLQRSVREIKVSREMGARYMTFEELLREEREEGRAEERMNTEREKARADAAEERADAAEARSRELEAEIARLKGQNKEE